MDNSESIVSILHNASKFAGGEDLVKRFEAAQKRGKSTQKANLALIRRLENRALKDLHDNFKPPLIPKHLWQSAYTIVWDRSGRAIREFCRSSGEKIAIARLHRAALDLDPETGIARYSYYGDERGSVRARRIFALGWLLLKLAIGTRRRGQFTRMVRGIPQTALLALLAGGRDARPHRNTLSGVHRVSERLYDVGYLQALAKADFFYTMQARWLTKDGDKPPQRAWRNIRRYEIAGSAGGYAWSLNRYYVITNQFYNQQDPLIKAKLAVDYYAGCQPLDEWFRGPPGRPANRPPQ